MEPNAENSCRRDAIKEKLRQNFDGKIVRKDLTKKIKEGANVPVYVLEFLLGQYCSSDDEAIIEKGVQNVKHILADNFVRPDEAQKILSQLRKKGSHTVIDMITVNLDIKKNCFFASFSNLGLDKVPIADEYPEKYDRLLCGGIWCIVQLDYEVEGDNNFGLVDLGGEPLQSSQKKQKDLTPISIRKLTPIQMPHIDIDELKRGRKAFTKDEWLDILLRSIGMEPDEFTEREKWLLLTRMIPLVENNFNLCELGPRSTGKSHLYKEISPNSILISGGQTTVANLFYNMGRKSVSSKDLPYTTQLIPLAVLCTLLADHNRIKTTSVKDKIKQWYWCGVFGEMYGSANETRYVYDVVGVMAWLEDACKTPKTVQEFYFNPVRLLSSQSRLSAAYKGIMARILKNQCKDFISGREMDFTVYKAESIDIHHIFPRDYCEKKGLPRAKWNSVVNKTPITYSTNREIGGVAPSQYLTKIEKKGQVEPDILDGYLKTHLIDTSDIRADRFDDFFIKRATAILNEIEKATGKAISGRDSDLVIQDFGGALL